MLGLGYGGAGVFCNRVMNMALCKNKIRDTRVPVPRLEGAAQGVGVHPNVVYRSWATSRTLSRCSACCHNAVHCKENNANILDPNRSFSKQVWDCDVNPRCSSLCCGRRQLRVPAALSRRQRGPGVLEHATLPIAISEPEQSGGLSD